MYREMYSHIKRYMTKANVEKKLYNLNWLYFFYIKMVLTDKLST